MIRSLNLPNALTFTRIILIPVMVLVFYLPFEFSHYACAFIFFMAGITDWLDGLLARKLGQMTRFGAFIDPVADKLIVTVSLALLIDGFHSLWITVPAIVIICREIVISALREWMAEIGKRANVAVNFAGKFKTMMQMLSIFMLFLAGIHNFDGFTIIGLAALYIAALLTVITMCIYLHASWKILKTQ